MPLQLTYLDPNGAEHTAPARVLTVARDYTVQYGDWIILVDANLAARTVTLPEATGSGREIRIKKVAGGVVGRGVTVTSVSPIDDGVSRLLNLVSARGEIYVDVTPEGQTPRWVSF